MSRVLFVQPREVDADQLVNRPSLPLALLSVASLVHRHHGVTILDQRLGGAWRAELRRALSPAPLVVGVSCLTGNQITFALRVSELVKSLAPGVPVVWGGIHAPQLARLALAHPAVDGVVSGEGEETFRDLVQALERGDSPQGIPGLWWKGAPPDHVPAARPFLDLNTLPELPYHLISVSRYVRYRAPGSSIMFESSRGCPHLCGFCACQGYSHRWRALAADTVVRRVLDLSRRFGARTVVIIDDNFMVDPTRAVRILDGLAREGAPVKLDLQGVRADALARLSDEELALFARAGVAKINVGVESGSPRVLELIRKGITVEQVLQQNRRLARHPVRVQYNFITGFPTETEQERGETVALALRLLRENRRAMLNYFCVFAPLPGTPLHDLAVAQGARMPATLEGWAAVDRIYVNRSGGEQVRRINVPLNFVSLFVDRKVAYYTESRLLGLLVALYRPLARYRFAHQDFRFLVEKRLFDALNRAVFGRS